MASIEESEKIKLFKKTRTLLARPTALELSDSTLCDLLDIAIEDYTQRIQMWAIMSNWSSVFGKKLDSIDFTFAMSTRSFDFEREYSYAFSKQVGLGGGQSKWELKKDFIILEAGKQSYEVPAGREINQVLWLGKGSMDAAILSNMMGINNLNLFGAGFGYSTVGGTSAFGGLTPILMSYDIMARAQDLNLKNRIFRSDLTYKITAGPNGTKIIHLLSVPGEKYGLSDSNATVNASGYMNAVGKTLFYYYYETTPETENECKLRNPDIVLTPDTIETGDTPYDRFNTSSKTFIRQLLVAEAKLYLGKVRGRFSGALGIRDAEKTMDYQMFLEEGQKEKETALALVDKMLDELKPERQLELSAKKATDLNTMLKYNPLGITVI